MVSSITNGQMYSKMNQLFPNADQILLTSDGAQALIAETAENVVVNTISDNDQLNLSSAIYDQLFKLLIDSSKHYDMVDRAIWNSVFWDSDNYRPDRVSNTVNEIYSKSNEQEKKYLKDVILGKTAVNTSLAVRFARVRANSGVSYDSLNENSTERDSMDNFLVENRNKIEWNDDRFQPKSMNLFAFNIANIRNRNFAEIKTQIKYTTSDLRLPISIDQIIQQKEYVDLENIKYEVSSLKPKLAYVFISWKPFFLFSDRNC